MKTEWTETTLRQIVACKGGISFPPASQGRRTGTIPFYKVSDMNTEGNSRFMDAANNYIEISDLPTLKANLHNPLSVVFPKVGGALLTNKKRMLSKASLVDNNIMVVSSLDKSVCDPHFLLMFFETVNLRELSNPGPLPSINAARVYERSISLPPLPEQKKIAAVLLKIQRAIETQEKIIKSLRDLKKSTMQHLFTHGLRGERTKMTEIGEIPESWEVVRFEDFVVLHRGYDLPIQNRTSGTVPIVGSNGIVGYHGVAKLKGPGVVTGRSGSIGMSYYVEQDYWPLNTGLYVSDFHGNLPLYVHYFFQVFNFAQYAAGVSVPTLNRNLVHAASIAQPDVNEQNEIANVLSTLDRRLESHESKKSALQDLFKTTLNKLMTSEIRVADLEIDVKEVEG